jgi:phosphohistidine phosphatase
VTAAGRTLVLVRHAIAEDRQAGKRDAERRLTPEGASKLVRAAAGLKRLPVEPTRILTSPLVRAVETAALLAEVLAPGLNAEVCAALAPGHHPQAVLDALAAGATGTIVLVGHEPDLGELASWLLTGSAQAARMPFRKGGAVAIELDPSRRKGPGVLCWALPPRALRALGEK